MKISLYPRVLRENFVAASKKNFSLSQLPTMRQSPLALADSLAGASFNTNLSIKKSTISPYPFSSKSTSDQPSNLITTKPPNTRPIRAYLVVLGGLLIHLCLGGQYITGNLLPYIASFLASEDGATISKYDYYSDICTWIYPLQAIGQCISMSYGGKLENKLGPKYTVFIGGFILSVGVLLTRWTCYNFYLLLLTYSIMHGIGIGIIYSSPLICSMKWFPDNKGFVNGIILAGFGLSPVIFTQIMTQLINPNNVTIDSTSGFLSEPQVLQAVPVFFPKLAGIYAAGVIFGALLLQNPATLTDILTPSSDGDSGSSVISLSAYMGNNATSTTKNEYTADFNEHSALIIEQTEDVIRSPKWQRFYREYSLEVMKEWRFWNLFLTFGVGGIMLTFFASQWKELSNKHLEIEDDFILSWMGSTGSVFNGVGRIVFGKLYDYTKSYRLVMGIMMFMETVLVVTWPYIDDIANDDDDVIEISLGFVWICALFLFYTGLFSIFPSYIAQNWGTTKTAVILGYIFLSGIPGNIFAANLIIQIRNRFGWYVLCYCIGGLGVVSFCLVMSINRRCK